ITVPRLVEPLALARLLRRAPPAPTVLVRLLGRAEVELAFRELVRRLLPDDEPAILGTGRAWHDRDAERVWAFCSAFEQRYFPLYECEEPRAAPLLHRLRAPGLELRGLPRPGPAPRHAAAPGVVRRTIRVQPRR